MSVSRIPNATPCPLKQPEAVSGQARVQQNAQATPQPVCKAEAPCKDVDSYQASRAATQEWATKYAAQSSPRSTQVAANDAANTVAGAQTQGGWKQTTPVIRQDQLDNCGAAVAAMLVRSQGGGVGKTDSELMAALENKYTNGKGTTPAQLGNMLAGEGFQVTYSADQFDHWGLDGALKKGRKVLAQVDSNAILPGKGDQQPGSSHWVEIDGMDKNGNYLVKDPARGTSYYVTLDDLRGAMNAGKESGRGGGMMLVKSADQGLTGAGLARVNANHCGVLGNDPGGGSRGSAMWRESGS